MGGHHHHGSALSAHRGRLAWVLGLSAAYMLAEAIGGWLTGSLALLADAAHMLSDVGALGLSLFAIHIARRPRTPQRTFGYYRTEILAALVNGATLLALSVMIFFEAAERWREPQEVAAPGMMAIAAGGLVINLIGLRLLAPGRSSSLNLRGAWLHVLTDALGSIQALVAGGLIWARGWLWADPLASALIGVLVIVSAWHLVRESVAVLMEGTPPHIQTDEVQGALLAVPGVLSVHDLHVWSITSGRESLSAHVVARDRANQEILRDIRTVLQDRFRIEHQTIQLETPEFERDCGTGCG